MTLDIVYEELQIDVGALGANDVIGVASIIDSSRRQGFKVMRTEYWIDFAGKTDGDGPVIVGFSANHGTDDIEECIEADPQGREEDESNGRARRPVWPLEMLPQAGVSSANVGALKGVFNPKWAIPEANGATWWAYNVKGVVMTTGTFINIFAKHFGAWLRD